MAKNYTKRIYHKLYRLCILLLFFIVTMSYGQETYSVLWLIDNANSIAGNTTMKLGDPIVIETEQGSVVEFDGEDDGLIVDSNPLEDAENFTVEVIFNPYEALISANEEQRFIHIQESDDRRILIELRITGTSEWFLDTFIKDGASSCTLYASEFPHSINHWFHAALVYEDGIMTHYVNGIKELSGNVQYSKMVSGQTSIGVRLNQRSWFKGAIQSLRVTNKALLPDEFSIEITGISNKKFELDHNIKDRKTEIYQNYPNPFNPETTIHFYLPFSEHIELSIFDDLGRKVSTLLNGFILAGSHRIIWNAKNDEEKLAGGIYFARIKSTTMSKSIRLVYFP